MSIETLRSEARRLCDCEVRSEDTYEIYLPAKGVPARYDIFFAHSRHVESIVLMTNCGLKGK